VYQAKAVIGALEKDPDALRAAIIILEKPAKASTELQVCTANI